LNDQSTTQKPDTRARIIEAARQLFFQQGYTATGIAQILQESDANSGSLYHFFPTKEDLLVAVLETYKEMLHPYVVQPAYERASDPVERVFAILDGYRQQLFLTEFSLGCPIGNLALEISNTHPRIRRLVAENFAGWCAAVEQSLQDSAGRFPADVDLRRLSHHVLATMEGAVMLARAYRDFEPFDDSVQQLRDYIERLVADGTDWSAPRSET
jgi:AcrR family transcriptional regulator